MNEKCSLDNLSRYLRVIGLLSLIIILIIVVYYYLQSNRSKILEKYESYALRECKVYFTEGDTNIKNCDITQETSNYTGTCSYRFDGWNEFDTYTDNDGKTITYPKKVYTQTRTNTNDFNNPMFTNNCFKAYTDETCLSNTPNDNCIPPEFEYNANNVVRYDEPGTSGNTAVGTNIYGGLRYSSMQFLNTADARYNNTNLISSICDVPLTDALGSLKDKVFYMFEFNGTTNKLENIRSVTLDSNQTTFSPVSSDNVLTNLPPRPTDASFYGIQYDATNRNFPIKLFKKNNIPRNVAVFKFNYMSYICTNSQIKNYMRANRIIIPEKFIKYGSSTTPNYSKNISIGNMTINKDWKWSNYSSADFNQDYSDTLKYDLNTSRDERRAEIDLSYAGAKAIAIENHKNALGAYNDANSNKDNFLPEHQTFSSLIGIQKENPITTMFDYIPGYNISSIANFNISIPSGAIAANVGSDLCIQFPYTGTPATNANTTYTFTTTAAYTIDILIVGGGGAGGEWMGAGGGAGGVVYAVNQTLPIGTYSVRVGRGGIGLSSSVDPSQLGANQDGVESSLMNSNGSSYTSFSLGGTSREMRGFGGGGGGTYYIDATLNGRNGGSGGGCTENNPNYGLKTPGTSIQPATYWNGSSYVVGGTSGRQNTTQFSDFQAGGGGGLGGQSTDYRNGNAGVAISITGTSQFYAAGGGAGQYEFNYSLSAGIGGSGIGGNGRIRLAGGPYAAAPRDVATSGANGTGSGGGGGAYVQAPVSLAGSGGSGIVIIRFKLTNSINNNPFGTLIDTTPSTNSQITNTITLSELKMEANILSSFIFLQAGTYKFRAAIEGQNNYILYAELIIYETINNNNNIIYRYGSKIQSYEIDIPKGKFYKLAFRYIYCNLTNAKIISAFKIYCDKQNLNLTNYLFGGANIKNDYTNNTYTNLFYDIKYSGNTAITYINLINYLNNPKGIDFFNIKKSYDKLNDEIKYKDITLPNEIETTMMNDGAIINIQGIIGKINELKSSRVNVNYNFHLPTTSPSIYKDITIDEIFGKNFDRLITKERVNPLNASSQTNTPPTKKIYVEAVAA